VVEGAGGVFRENTLVRRINLTWRKEAPKLSLDVVAHSTVHNNNLLLSSRFPDGLQTVSVDISGCTWLARKISNHPRNSKFVVISHQNSDGRLCPAHTVDCRVCTNLFNISFESLRSLQRLIFTLFLKFQGKLLCLYVSQPILRLAPKQAFRLLTEFTLPPSLLLNLWRQR